MDEITKTYLLVIVLIIIGVFVLTTIPISISYHEPYPLSCGLTQVNKSESYMIQNMCGMSQCPTTYYYKDLVCTNGTTILKYSGGNV